LVAIITALKNLPNPETGECTYFWAPYSFLETTAKMQRDPLLGEHNEYVAKNILGLSDREFVSLINEGFFNR